MQSLKVILKKLWLVILLPIIAAGTAYLCSIYLIEPVYEADITLYINNSSLSGSVNSDSMITRQYFVKDYNELIKSRAVILPVITELGLSDISPEQLAKDIAVNSKNNTNLIEIKVKYSNPVQTMQIADTVGNVFIREVSLLIGLNNVSIVDSAILPDKPKSPDIIINALAAVFAGIMSAIGIALLFDYLDKTVKTEKDIEEYLKLKCLGIIPNYD
jgi:capsular polysaccharide biosynthesis protein